MKYLELQNLTMTGSQDIVIHSQYQDEGRRVSEDYKQPGVDGG